MHTLRVLLEEFLFLMSKIKLNDNYTGPIIVICEGDSEKAYIQNINRILHYKNSYGGALFKPIPVNTGYFDKVKIKYRTEKKNNQNSTIVIWLDYDIYKRNSKKCMDFYMNRKGIPDFLFSHMNFEDFLILHENEETISKWKKLSGDHFEEPMQSSEYQNKFKQIMPNYKKGELTPPIDKNRFETMLRNLESGKFYKNDFGKFLLDNIKDGFFEFND